MALANRNGYFFLLDRTNGRSLVVKPLIPTANAYKGVDGQGVLIPDKAKEPSQGGALVSLDSLSMSRPIHSDLRGKIEGYDTNSGTESRLESEGMPQGADFMVELSGIEPLTSSLRIQTAPRGPGSDPLPAASAAGSRLPSA